MLEPHHGETSLLLDLVDRPRPEDARPIGDLDVSPEVARLRCLRLGPFVVLGIEADDPLFPVTKIEDEHCIERPQAIEIPGIETAGRVLEADSGHRAGRVGHPCTQDAVRQLELAGQIAEEVEGQCR